MDVILTPDALADLEHWRNSGNRRVQAKISALIDAICQSPYDGPGKPERLKHELAGKWSRRIDREHRLVYAVEEDVVNIYSLKGHYKKRR